MDSLWPWDTEEVKISMAAGNGDEILWGWQSKMKTVAERGKHILGIDYLCDVTFRVGPKDGETADIKAHKFFLATGSAVFETMFYGNLPDTNSIVPITDIDPEPFRILLRYLYHDQIGPFDFTTAFATLYAAKKYGLPILKDACEEYLRTNISAEGCLDWFVQAKMYDEPELAEFLLSVIDSQGPLVLQSADFLKVDIETVKEILSRDSLRVREVDVYNAAVRWAKNQCAKKKLLQMGLNIRSVLGNALFLIRFPIMTSHEVASGPVKLGVLLAEEVQQLFQYWYANEILPGNFNTAVRHLSAELHIARFGGKQDGWTYAAGRLNGIRLCITSVTDKVNRNVDLASVGLIAVGFYLSTDMTVLHCPGCGVVRNPFARSRCKCFDYFLARSTAPVSSPTISLKFYIEEGPDQKELEEFRQTFHPPAGETRGRVQKIILSKAVPLKMHQRYTVSADITGIHKSYYGTEGNSSATVATSSGDRNITVLFSSLSEAKGSQASGARRGGEPFGITSVTQGQLPEFFFEIIG